MERILNRTAEYREGVAAVPDITSGPDNKLTFQIPARQFAVPVDRIMVHAIPESGIIETVGGPNGPGGSVGVLVPPGETSYTVQLIPKDAGTTVLNVIVKYFGTVNGQETVLERRERPVDVTVVEE